MTHEDRAAQPSACQHYYAWVSPAGASASARLCQVCHQPDPDWLDRVSLADSILTNARTNAAFASGPVSIYDVREWLR